MKSTEERVQLLPHLARLLLVLTVAVGLALGLLYVVRVPLLSLLFAPRLTAAAPLLAPQLLGDWAKFLSWVFQYTLLVRGRPGPYLVMQGGGVALYAGLLAVMVPHLGLPGVVDAYALDACLTLAGCAVDPGAGGAASSSTSPTGRWATGSS